MKKYHRYIVLFWLALGLFVAIYSYRLGLGKISSPGAGLMPFGLGVLFSALALGTLVGGFVRPDREMEAPKKEKTERAYAKLGVIVAALFGYGIFLETIGYQITTFVVLIFLFRSAGVKRWTFVLLDSVLTVTASYFLFTYLGVRFPSGILRFIGLE